MAKSGMIVSCQLQIMSFKVYFYFFLKTKYVMILTFSNVKGRSSIAEIKKKILYQAIFKKKQPTNNLIA